MMLRFPRLPLVAALAALSLTVGCGTSDDPVPGPAGYDTVSGDIDGGTIADTGADTGTGVDSVDSRTLDFTLVLAGDVEALKGATGGILALSQDKYPGVNDPGFQADLKVTATGVTDGTKATVTLAGKSIGEVTINGGAATLEKIDINCLAAGRDSDVLEVLVDADLGVGKGVGVNCNNACTATLTQPAACATKDADPQTPGFQVTVEVSTTTTDCTHAYVEFKSAEGTVGTSAEVPLSGGKASVTFTASSKDSGLVNAAVEVTAKVKDKANAQRPEGTSATASFELTTEAPVLAISQPSASTLTLADDTNGNPADGLQVLLFGTATGMKALDELEVLVDGVSVGKTNIAANGTSFQQTVTFSATKSYNVTVKGTNSCGLTGEVSKAYSAVVSKAALQITKPAGGAKLLAKDDADPSTATVYDTSVEVTVADGQPGTKVSVFCRANQAGAVFGSQPVGEATLQAGAAGVLVPVKLDVTSLTQSVVCKAVDDGANKSESPEHGFQLGLPAPCLDIALPAANATVAMAVLPVNATATGLDGQVVEANVALAGGSKVVGVLLGKVANGAVASNLSLTAGTPAKALPDGDYVLTLEAQDSFGNLASESACSDVSRTFTIDTTGPKLALSAPTKKDFDEVKDTDADPKTPGFQIDTSVAVTGEKGESTVCLKANGFDLGCQKVTGAGSIDFKGVQLQGPKNVLVFSSTDAFGNKGADLTETINFTSNAVVVTWDDPNSNKTIATDNITVRAKVTDQNSGAAIAGAKVAVYLNGAVVPTAVVTESAGGLYTSSIGGLSATKPNEIQFVVTPSGGGSEGVSPKLIITRKTGSPTVAIAAPADKALLNLASSACLGGVADCNTTVELTTVNAEDGSTVKVDVDCAGTKSSKSGTVSGGKASVAGVVLKNNGSCTLGASVTDLAGQSASATPVTVSVDRTAPKLSGIKPAKTTLLATDDINGDAKDGIQFLVSVVASGIAKDAPITLTVYNDDGTKAGTYTSQAHPAAADGVQITVSFGAVTIPDGEKIKLEFATTDAAGNPATPLVVVVSALAASPDIRISTPTYVAPKDCKASSECGQGNICTPSGKCALPWSISSSKEFIVIATGSLSGAKARICSNAKSASGGTACATIGYYQISATETVQSGTNSIKVPLAKDDDHTIIAEMLPAGGDASKAGDWVSSTKTSGGVEWESRSIYLDTQAPVIKSVLPSSSATAPQGCLNAAMETKANTTAGGSFAFAATLDGEEGTVKLLNGSSEVGVGASNKLVAGVTATLGEGKATLSAVATDLVGNESKAFSVGTYTVDTLKPTGQFTSPNKSPLIVGDSLDVTVSSTASDVEGQPVVLKDGTKTVGTVSMKSGVAGFPNATYKTLTDGSHVLSASITDTCGNEGTATTTPATVVVDTAAPTVTVSAPTQGQVLKDNDDASASTGGYQVAVTFNTSGAKTWKVILGTDCDSGFVNCNAFNQVASGNVTNDGGAEPTQNVTLSFGSTTNYVVRVTVTDDNGNTTSSDRGFSVQLSGCLVSATGLPSTGVMNTASCATAGKDCASVTKTVTVDYKGPCGNPSAIVLYKDGKQVDSKSPSSSAASFSVTFNHGDNVSYEAKVVEGSTEKGSSGAQKVLVDLKNPVVKFIAGTVLGFTTPDGTKAESYGSSADQDKAQNGVQVHALLQVADGNLATAQVTKLQNTAGGSGVDLTSALKLPATIGGTTSTNVEIKFITLPDNATSTVVATVVDGAGNTSQAAFTAVVDVTAPGAVTLQPLTAADVNPRRPWAKLTVTATGDDGTTGQAAKYEVRYSKSDITSTAEFEAACDVTALPDTKLATPSAAGKSDTLLVEGPDPRASSDACKFAPMTDAAGTAKWYFAARAVDEAGNAGPVSASVSTADIRLRYAKITSTTSPWNNAFGFGFVSEVGDLNGDGKGDIAYGGFLAPHFCVVYGQADGQGGVPATINVNAASSSAHNCLTGSSAIGSKTAGKLDVNGDGVDDLVVDYGQKSNDGAARELRVHLGVKGQALTSTAAVTIKGISSPAPYGVLALGSAGNFTGDVSNAGNPIDDIVVTVSPSTGTTYYTVMVIPGNAAWATGSPTTIDLSSATDRKTHGVMVFHNATKASSSQFGTEVVGVGNMLSDAGNTQYDDLAIAQFNDQTSVWVIKGRPAAGDTTYTYTTEMDGSGSDEANAVSIRPHASFTGGGNFKSPRAASFDGDSVPDLIVSQRDSGKPAYVYWLKGSEIAKNLGKRVFQTGKQIGSTGLYTTPFGWYQAIWMSPAIPLGNFGDQVGSGAIAIGGGAPSTAPNGSSVFSIRYPIVRTDSANNSAPSYHVEDISFQNPYNAGSKTMGVFASAPAGDFNGDGYPDIMIGTFGGTGYSILVY